MRLFLFLIALFSMMGCEGADAQNMKACGSMCGAFGVAQFTHMDDFAKAPVCVCNKPATTDGGRK